MSDTKPNALHEGFVLTSPLRRYKIVSMIGCGGFGITYKAVVVDGNDMPVGDNPQYYAIKELFLEEYSVRCPDNTVAFSANAQTTVRNAEDDFIREATILNRLGTHHPNIVFIHEAFRANNTCYYSMDFLEGETLQDYIKRCGPQPIKWAMKLIAPLFGALECLHANKMTHLDIKPSNIIMVKGKDGKTEPVLIDFGLTKHYDEDGNSTSLIHNVACSKGYAPLEQYAGLSTFTPQADVYALTATLYYCLTGAAPEIASEISPKTIGAALPEQLPESARSAVMRGMLKNKDLRTASIEALRQDLAKYMPADLVISKPIVIVNDKQTVTTIKEKKSAANNGGAPAKASTHSRNVDKRKKSNPMVYVAVALLIAVVCGSGVYFFAGSKDTKIREAIEQGNTEVLEKYANKGDTNAIIGLAELYLDDAEYVKSARQVRRLLGLNNYSPTALRLRDTLANVSYKEYYDRNAARYTNKNISVDEVTKARYTAESTFSVLFGADKVEEEMYRRASEMKRRSY